MNKPTSKNLNLLGTEATNELTSAAERLGLTLTELQMSEIEQFLSLLRDYNEHTNLVSNADPDVVVREHVIDALTLAPLLRKRLADTTAGLRLVDIGSGAGFPAIILAIVFPEIKVLCIDSVGKKTRFMEQAVDALKLNKRVTISNARAEELARHPTRREKYDVATARAVGKLDLVAELALPFLRIGGVLLSQKSREQATDELLIAERAFSVLGAGSVEVITVDAEITGKDLVVVAVEKAQRTMSRYPRPSSQMKKPIV